jgi:hypothetical protein
MIFEWSRESRTWELLADTGELLGRAWPLGAGIYQAEMSVALQRRSATSSSLGELQTWMMNTAAGIEP